MSWPPTEDVPERNTGRHGEGTCQECSEPQWSEHFQKCVAGFGWVHRSEYSCSHYKELRESSPCKYCGKKNSPVRQVPASCPISDCYCDDCAEKCAEEYSKVVAAHRASGL